MENNKGRSERAERAQRRQNNKDADRQRAERAERARRRSQSKEGCAGRQQQADKDVTPEIQEAEREFQLSEDIVGPPENFGLSTGNTVGLEVEQLDNAVDLPDITGEDKKNKTDDSDDEVSSTSSNSSSSSSSASSGSDSDRHSDDSSETVYYTTAYGSDTRSDSDESKLKGIQGATIEMATTVFDLYL
eukprot:jgi/Psemu1/9215/gm1.9215_g